MTNGKRRRLAKVQVGGNVGAPSPLGSRSERRRPVDKAAMENSHQTRLRLVRESLRQPADDGKTDASSVVALYSMLEAPSPEAAVGDAAE